MIILLHSSKTMKSPGLEGHNYRAPELITHSQELAAYLKTLAPNQLTKAMHVSAALATKTHATLQDWNTEPRKQSLAIDSFVGDIYSGLRASELSKADRDYADTTLRILSGLYGIIRPYDAIMPYRLEMGYRLPDAPYSNLYAFWGKLIAATLPKEGPVVNASSAEYTKAVLPFVDPTRVITPKFLTVDPKSGEPTFVVVHAKIARGAFARWLITSRVTDPADFIGFNDIGYKYDKTLSTSEGPAFVCREFLGKGLSMRTA